MYFEDTDFNSWNLKTAFEQYYEQCSQDFQRANDRIKKDLEEMTSKPNYLQAAIKKAQQYLKNWNKYSKDFKYFRKNLKENKTEIITNNVYGGQNINTMNNNAQNVTFCNYAEGSGTNNASKKRKIRMEDSIDNEDDINSLFNPKPKDISIDDYQQNNEDEEPPLYIIEKHLKNSADNIGEWVIDDINVTQKFKKFMMYSIERARSTGLLIESHAHHILSLSSVFLIKENQHHPDLLEYFEQEELDIIINHLKNHFIPGHNNIEFPDEVFIRIKRLIKRLLQKEISRDDAVKSLFDLKSEVSDDEFKIIKTIINCINKLPFVKIVDPIGEIDLCSSYLDSVLSPIMTDFGKNMMLRWPNLKSKETQIYNNNVNKQRRPDAVTSMIDQHSFGANRAFGEVKTQEREKDMYELIRDLIRVGIFSKESIDCNDVNSAIGFQAVGSCVRFYVISLVERKLYIMFEFAHIQVPMSLVELPSFCSQLDTLLQIKHCFDSVCATTVINIENSWKAPTLDSPNFKTYIHSTKSAKRPSSIIF